MKIVLSLGHTILKNGNCTSANGYVNEYNYNKKLIKMVKDNLVEMGHTVYIVITPEKKLSKAEEEIPYKTNLINKTDAEIGVELHLNCYDRIANGSEVCYYPSSKNGEKLAQSIQDKLAKNYKDRGIKERHNLGMLRKTKIPFVIVESFFCDNQEDCKKLKKKKLAFLIASGIDNYAKTQENKK